MRPAQKRIDSLLAGDVGHQCKAHIVSVPKDRPPSPRHIPGIGQPSAQIRISNYQGNDGWSESRRGTDGCLKDSGQDEGQELHCALYNECAGKGLSFTNSKDN